MMKSEIAVSILDPYDWLPSYGENSVSIESRDLEFIVKIANENQGPNYRELRFDKVCDFHHTSFPGLSRLDIDYSSDARTPLTGTLIEYPDSEVAIAWSRHFGGIRHIKHYKIIFLSENISLEIFAENVILSSEFSIPRE
ncbi:hypothetical protein I4P15_19220 [Enterobacter roggenkampii]|nr:hypothetical protein [Enterobacter roggenkampii]